MQRRALYTRCLKSSDYRTALGVLRDEGELQGLYPAKKIAPTTPDGKDPYDPLGFAEVVPELRAALERFVGLPPSPLGRRMPFVLLGTPPAVAGLVLLPFGPSIALAGAAVLAFFVGYYIYYPPYRALYADLLPRTLYARAQAGQAIARGLGLGFALLTGGLLLGLWQPLAFLIAAVVLVATTTALLPVFRLQSRCHNSTLPYEPAPLRRILRRNPSLRLFARRKWPVDYFV